MKPFNLDEVLKTGEAVTRSGHKVTNITLYPDVNSAWCLAGVVHMGKQRNLETWTKDGTSFRERWDARDLFCKPVQKKAYINIYKNDNLAQLYNTRVEADSVACRDRLTCTEISWEE